MPPLNMPLASLLLANALVPQMMAGAGAAAGSLHMHAAGPDTQYFCGDLGVPRWQRQRGPRTEATGAGGALPLLLPPAVGCPPEVLSLNAAVQPAPFEAAGASHQRLLRLRAGIADDEQEGSDAASTSRTASPNTATFDHDGLHGDDHYSVLGLGDLRWRATEDQIKKAYHKTSLRCHPDKVRGLGEAGREAADEHYKKINKAYAVLSNPQKRMGYDSLDETQDALPTAEEVQEGGFFPVMTYYFDINARWSIDKRIPSLGNATTPMSEVERFYDFWDRFKSWRDFSTAGEHDPELATNRHERRQMLKDNERAAKSKKLEESKRLAALMSIAKQFDPRIRAADLAARKKKEDAARARANVRKAEEEAARQAEAAAAEAVAAAAERERVEHEARKRSKEDARFHLRIAKKRLRQVVEDVFGVTVTLPARGVGGGGAARRAAVRGRVAGAARTDGAGSEGALIESIVAKMDHVSLMAFADDLHVVANGGQSAVWLRRDEGLVVRDVAKNDVEAEQVEEDVAASADGIRQVVGEILAAAAALSDEDRLRFSAAAQASRGAGDSSRKDTTESGLERGTVNAAERADGSAGETEGDCMDAVTKEMERSHVSGAAEQSAPTRGTASPLQPAALLA